MRVEMTQREHRSGSWIGQFKTEDETMAFINERIPEADKARIDFTKTKHPLHGGSIVPFLSQWTIDREQDIALIPLGGGGLEYPYFFVIYWQGRTANVFLNATYTGNFTTSDLEVTWSIDHMEVPAGVTREEVLKIMRQALLTFGYETIRLRDKVKAVHFKF